MKNEFGRAIWISFLLLISSTSCQSSSERGALGAATSTRLPLGCNTKPKALVATPVPVKQANSTLEYLQTFEREIYSLTLTDVTLLTGACAPSVNATLLDKVGLVDGSVYQLKDDGLVAWPVPFDTMFDRVELAESRKPALKNARFLHAVEVESKSTNLGIITRYLGVLQQGSGSVVVDFAVSADGQQPIKVRPLIRSMLPLRSVSYFPSPDTASGSIFLVQERSISEVRVLRLNWWHKV